MPVRENKASLAFSTSVSVSCGNQGTVSRSVREAWILSGTLTGFFLLIKRIDECKAYTRVEFGDGMI